MDQHSAVLKKGTFNQVGPRRPGGADPGAPAPVAGEAVVRIVQDRPEGVVIEVICPCGRTLQVECNYDQTPEPAPEPGGSGGSGVE